MSTGNVINFRFGSKADVRDGCLLRPLPGVKQTQSSEKRTLGFKCRLSAPSRQTGMNGQAYDRYSIVLSLLVLGRTHLENPGKRPIQKEGKECDVFKSLR